MEDEAILLKIKRQFTKDESVNALLKIIAELRFENGILKSEVAEAKFTIHDIKNKAVIEGRKTKKEWLKDDMIAEMKKGMDTQQNKNKLIQKQLIEYTNKYFSLLAKTNVKL